MSRMKSVPSIGGETLVSSAVVLDWNPESSTEVGGGCENGEPYAAV